MIEQTKQQEDQDTSIVRSMDFMTKMLANNGAFSYLPANKKEPEQTISFDTIVSDCADKPGFVNAMYELFKAVKTPFSEQDESMGAVLIAFIAEVDKLVSEHVEFAAKDEHGIEV